MTSDDKPIDAPENGETDAQEAGRATDDALEPAQTDGADHLDDNAVPDAGSVDAGDPWASDMYLDSGEFYLGLGGEAYVPEGDYGPPVESHFPDMPTKVREAREIERRLRDRISLSFPREYRRHLPLEGVWKRFRNVAMRGRSDMVDDFGRDPRYSARYAPILDFLYKRWFRVDVRGLEHVPDTGRAILVANHSGLLPYDGLLVMHALRREHPAHREARPLIEDFVFHFPYLGALVNRIGGVRACQENAEHLLAKDNVIVVFPEGLKGISKLYKDRYKLQRFGRGGFVKLALRTGSPVIPVAIVGAEETNPVLGKVTWLSKFTGVPFLPLTPTGLAPLPIKWFMRFGEPIDMSQYASHDAARDRILVNRLTDNVRSTIQSMVDDTLARRRSVIFG
jgi:1-acyl-sn-glycerol-3-phosphate acyltransferase